MSKKFLTLKKTMLEQIMAGIFLILLVPVTAIAGPVILYTDILSGPKTGGENNNGTYLSIFGKGFGTSRGTSTVKINGVEVAAYKCWNCSDQYGRSDIQKITVQPGGAVSSGPIAVTVNGVGSNNNLTFTVRSGDIYFVSHSGSDSGGTIGDINDPFRTIQTTYGRSDFGAGDTIVIRGDGAHWNDSDLLFNGSKGGAVNNEIAILGYPGENVQVDAPSSSVETFRLNSGADYTIIAGLNMEATGVYNLQDNACFNVNDGQQYVRIINNDVEGCRPGQQGAFHWSADNFKILGNSIHNNGQTPNDVNTSHAIYLCCSSSSNGEIGWNHIYNQDGGRALLNRVGSTEISIHDNFIHDIARDGILIGQEAVGPFYVYNNICTRAGLENSASGCFRSQLNNVTTYFYNNTIYDSNDTLVDLSTGTHDFRNNIIYAMNGQTCVSGSGISGSNNLFFGCSTPSWSTNSVNGNPLFVDPTSPSNNFHIQTGSPAIDAGENPSLLGSLLANFLALLTRDSDGTLRTSQGSTFDIGAYEYCESGCAVTDTMPPSRPTGLLIQ